MSVRMLWFHFFTGFIMFSAKSPTDIELFQSRTLTDAGFFQFSFNPKCFPSQRGQHHKQA